MKEFLKYKNYVTKFILPPETTVININRISFQSFTYVYFYFINNKNTHSHFYFKGNETLQIKLRFSPLTPPPNPLHWRGTIITFCALKILLQPSFVKGRQRSWRNPKPVLKLCIVKKRIPHQFLFSKEIQKVLHQINLSAEHILTFPYHVLPEGVLPTPCLLRQ